MGSRTKKLRKKGRQYAQKRFEEVTYEAFIVMEQNLNILRTEVEAIKQHLGLSENKTKSGIILPEGTNNEET